MNSKQHYTSSRAGGLVLVGWIGSDETDCREMTNILKKIAPLFNYLIIPDCRRQCITRNAHHHDCHNMLLLLHVRETDIVACQALPLA